MEGFEGGTARYVTVKATLLSRLVNAHDDQCERRRFRLDAGEQAYQNMRTKIGQLFPQAGDFTINWKDADGDSILCTSPEEFGQAVASMTDDVLRLNVTPQSAVDPLEPVHNDVMCDGCAGPICGSRYRCARCPDYDLCRRCEASSLHSDHPMIRMNKPRIETTNGSGLSQRCNEVDKHKQGNHHLANHQVAPFPRWNIMMNRLWNNRARQLCMNGIVAPSDSHRQGIEAKTKKRWLHMMRNAWEELVGESNAPAKQFKRRWRQTVLNCCDVIQHEQSVVQIQTLGVEQSLAQLRTSEKSDVNANLAQYHGDRKVVWRQWRQTMRQCWREMSLHSTMGHLYRGHSHGHSKHKQSASWGRKGWHHKVRQMATTDASKITPSNVPSKTKHILMGQWRQHHNRSPPTLRTSNRSPPILRTSHDANNGNKPVAKDVLFGDVEPKFTMQTAKPTVGVAFPTTSAELRVLSNPSVFSRATSPPSSRPVCNDPRFLGPPLRIYPHTESATTEQTME